jgi:hypothetical protein
MARVARPTKADLEVISLAFATVRLATRKMWLRRCLVELLVQAGGLAPEKMSREGHGKLDDLTFLVCYPTSGQMMNALEPNPPVSAKHRPENF